MRVAALLGACWLAVCALSIGMAGCSTPPARDEIMNAAGEAAPTPGPRRSESLDGAALRRAAPTEAQRRFVRRLDAFESAIAHRPLLAGNLVTLLVDGPATHAAQLAAIARARHHIHLVTYILSDDVVGRQYRDALIERARAGVRVRLMYDSFGGLGVGSAFREALEKNGVEVHEYASINPIEQPELWRLSQRNHRKLLIVDGRVAFTGGINISDTYTRSSASGSAEHGWRDTHIQILGPSAAEFQRLFFEDWQREVGPIEDDVEYWPELRARGVELVRAVANQGADVPDQLWGRLARLWRTVRIDRHRHAIYASYLGAISESRSRIWITQAYFAPNREFRDALAHAAQRGCDVRLLVPANSDVGLLFYASRNEYADLLKAGVRIFEYEGPVLHAKTAVVDGVWSTVGSSNLDYMSFIHNDEANAIIIGHSFALAMEEMFRRDLANAREVTPEGWRERPFSDRVLQALAGSLKYWI